MNYKRGQMKLSFGMIFSIFLIIIFIAFAVYGIIKFINLQQDLQIENFVLDLQNDVEKMWKAPKGSSEEVYSLPKKVISVCFVNTEFENLIIRYSDSSRDERKIEKINLEDITSVQNPYYCILNIDGRVTITLYKDFGEDLVKISSP